MKATVRHSVVLYLLASSLFLTACGSSNSSSPNPAAGNIPNLAAKPSAQASTLKTQRFTGTVINGYTLEPVDNAEITLKIQAEPAPAASATPPNNTGQNNPSPPSSNPNSSSTPFPNAVPTAVKAPSAQPSITAPSASPSTGFSVNGSIPTLPNATSTPPGSAPVGPGLPGTGIPGGSDAVQPDNSGVSTLGAAPTEVLTRYVGSQAVTPVNAAANSTLNLFETNSNNRGKFFINDVPEGKHTISVSAPGYRSITLTDVDPNRLEIPLVPLNNDQMMDIVGSVLSPTDTPIADALVSSSFPMGSAIGIPATSNSLGEFKLPAVPFGRRSFVAFVQNPDGDIRQMGLLKNIIVNNKSIKDQELVFKEKPSTLPGPDGTPKPTAEELIENVNKILSEATPGPAEAESPAATESPAIDKDVSPYASSTPETIESPIISPPIEPYPTPSAASENPQTIEENQEAVEEKKGTNVFDTVKNFFTGEKEDESEAIKIAPVISLRSVLENMVLSGKVQVPEGYTLKSMDVYISLEPEEKGAHPEEAYLLTKTFTAPPTADKSLISKGNQKSTPSPTPSPSTATESKKGSKEPQSFRVNLPVLSGGQKYHLQFTATHVDGGLTYHHIYNLADAADSLSVDFLPVMSKLEIQGESDNTIPATPTMAWDAVSGAEIYHVTLTEGNNAGRKVIWEGWTKSTQIDYPFTSRKLRLKEQETYVLAVSALKGLKPVVNKSNNVSAHPGYQAVWSDLSRVTHIPFEVVE